MTRCPICRLEFRPRKKGKAGIQKFCSRRCLAVWNSKKEKGSGNPNWQGGSTRWKKCELCYTLFFCTTKGAFLKRRFCSQRCGWKGQNSGRRRENNPNWKGGVTNVHRAERSSLKHKEWSRKVFKRDSYTCQACFKRGGDLHSHHLLSFILYEKFRYLRENGITLCLKCHYTTYTFSENQYKKVSTEKGVNSENIPIWGQLRTKLLDEIRQKRGLTVKVERTAIIPINAPPERDDMT